MSVALPFNNRQGWLRLAGVSAVAAVLWLVVLPRLSLWPPISARLQWLEEQRVDPSAMYYTEVDALKPVLERLEQRRRAPAREAGVQPAKED